MECEHPTHNDDDDVFTDVDVAEAKAWLAEQWREHAAAVHAVRWRQIRRWLDEEPR